METCHLKASQIHDMLMLIDIRYTVFRATCRLTPPICAYVPGNKLTLWTSKMSLVYFQYLILYIKVRL